jgi:predicted transcriptional regulator
VKGGAAKGYRSKLEVLRDFLRAAQEPVPKTRIIGAANLNPLSFRRYLRVCTERDLITSVSGGYVTTPRAGALLEAIDSVMVKREELEQAVRALGRHSLESTVPDGLDPTRRVLREAWNEITLESIPRPNGHRSAVTVSPVGETLPGRPPRDRPSPRRPRPPAIPPRAGVRRSSRSPRGSGRGRLPASRPRSSR